MQRRLLGSLNILLLKMPTSNCTLWTGYKNRNGFGQQKFRGGTWLAHRVAWVLERGEIPAGKFVLHTCENHACIDSAHLYLGDAKIAKAVSQQRGNQPLRRHGTVKMYGVGGCRCKQCKDAKSREYRKYKSK